MDGISCDACGRGLLLHSNVRYEVKIEVRAAYDPLEITRADLEKDLRAEIRKTLEECRRRSPEELENEVYRSFRFDLCPDCRRRYLKNPLPSL